MYACNTPSDGVKNSMTHDVPACLPVDQAVSTLYSQDVCIAITDGADLYRLSLFMLCKPLSILPTAWAVSGSVHVFTNRGNSLNKAFTSGSQSSFLASHRASCLPLVFWKVHYMSWLIEVTLSTNLSLQDNPSFNLSSHRASWLRLALSGS